MAARLKWLPAAICALAVGAATPAVAAQTNQKPEKGATHPTAKARENAHDRQTRKSDENMRFASMDKNHDGVITRAEWSGSEKSFKQHDWNHDSVLSGDEVKPGAKRPGGTAGSVTAPEATRGVAGESDEVLFGRLDANRDGRISRDEWEAAKKSPQQFDALDRDHDGFLSPYEFGVGR